MLRIVAVFAFLFSSCASKSDSSLAVFKAADEGFQHSNDAISNANNNIYRDLEKKLSQPETARQALIWQPKALLIKEKSTTIFIYLDSLITTVKKEAGLRLENMQEMYNEDEENAASRLFIDKKIGDELFEKLQKYKNYILAVDPELNHVFADNSIIITREFDRAGTKPKDFATAFFYQAPAVGAIAMLRKLENNVRVLENNFVTFCFHKIGSLDGDGFFTKFEAIVGQSTNIIKAGDQMQIFAGVGSFSVACKPIITIDKKVFQPTYSEGVVSYKFKTPIKSGKYIVPVIIDYIGEDGSKRQLKNKIEYTVVE